MRSLYAWMAAGALAAGVASCSTNKQTLQRPDTGLPTAYPNAPETSDTTSAAALPWKSFFGDSLLLALIDTALQRNYDLLEAAQKIEMARAGLRQARGEQMPFLNVRPTVAQRRFGLYTMDGAGNISTEIRPGEIVPINLPDFFTGADMVWEADLRGKLRNMKRAAAMRFLESVDGRNLVQSHLVAMVAATYTELAATDRTLAILNQSIATQNQAIEVVELQKEAGRATEVAVQQFLAQLYQMRAMEYETRQRRVEIENYLNFLLGRYPQSIEVNPVFLSTPVANRIDQGLPGALLWQRPDVRAAEQALRATRFDVRAARAEFYPRIDVAGTIGYQAYRTDLLWLSPTSLAYTALAGLVAPLVNYSAIRARFEGANAAQLAALYNYQETVLTAYMEVVNQLSNLENTALTTGMRQQEVAALSSAVEASVELYRTAKAGYLEVLLAQQNALGARLNEVEARQRQQLAAIQLYRALGGGWR